MERLLNYFVPSSEPFLFKAKARSQGAGLFSIRMVLGLLSSQGFTMDLIVDVYVLSDQVVK